MRKFNKDLAASEASIQAMAARITHEADEIAKLENELDSYIPLLSDAPADILTQYNEVRQELDERKAHNAEVGKSMSEYRASLALNIEATRQNVQSLAGLTEAEVAYLKARIERPSAES
ncbi:hypothetical protein [Leifsonia aquatica]|uniref:hypothetical protein n=1 Tax=Leifsonia aquatica TaxID=144185 RepID=UPI00046A19D6|nr:hypothetical protein [Leifsonia aquatica]